MSSTHVFRETAVFGKTVSESPVLSAHSPDNTSIANLQSSGSASETAVTMCPGSPLTFA